jgi:hypothetical protein
MVTINFPATIDFVLRTLLGVFDDKSELVTGSKRTIIFYTAVFLQ